MIMLENRCGFFGIFLRQRNMFFELRVFLQRISRREWRIVWLLALALALVTSLPLIFAYVFGASRGMIWTGRQFLAPGDSAAYFSYITQVTQGIFLFRDLFTTENVPSMLNIFWLTVGFFAKLFSWSPIAAYYIFRVLLIFPFCAVAYALIAYFFVAVRERMVALACLLFSSGLGLFFEPFFANAAPTLTSYARPVDLWVAESITFLTVLYSPHFIASLTLFLAIVFFLLFAWQTERRVYGVIAGVCGLLLFNFHPFHAPTLYSVPLVYGIVRFLRKEKRPKNFWWSYALFVIISVPSVAYHFLLARSSAIVAVLNAQNVTLTPPFWYVLIGFGVWSVAWIGTYHLLCRGYDKLRDAEFLCVWAGTHMALLYAPMLFQRRLIEGLQFPLIMLGVPALCALYARLVRSPYANRAYVLGFLGMILLSSNIYAIRTDIQVFAENYRGYFYVDQNEAAMWRWITENVPRSAVIIATPQVANAIPGFTGRKVFAGQWALTIDMAQKKDMIIAFYQSSDAAARKAFLKKNGITYVLYGSQERSLVVGKINMQGLQSVFRAGDMEIFAVQ